MKFSLAVLLLGTASYANAATADCSKLVSQLKKITNQIGALDASIKSFSGGINQALAIQSQTYNTETTLRQAAQTANTTGSLNGPCSKTVTLSIAALAPEVFDTLDDLIAKKPTFDNTTIGSQPSSNLVYQDLETLQKLTDKLGKNIIAILVPSLKQVGPLLTSDLDYHFRQALKVYMPKNTTSS